MGLDAMWQKFAITSYQVWVWLKYEASLHPFLFLGAVIIIISAWVLYKSEVRSK
jgi:hypothetical protein